MGKGRRRSGWILSRRGFFAAACAAAVAALCWRAAARCGIAGLTLDIVRRRFPYLTHLPGEAAKFSKAYAEYRGLSRSLTLRFFLYHHTGLALGAGLKNLYTDYCGNLAEHYLMASSFFRTGMDERRPLEFVSLWDPYAFPCANPFGERFHQAELIAQSARS